MELDVNRLYQTYIQNLSLGEKLELLELLMQETIDFIRKENVSTAEASHVEGEQQEESTAQPGDSGLTPFQKQLLNGPVMSDEDYNLYVEKKQHFAKWK